MLLDLIQTYSEEQKGTLRDLWTKTIEDLARQNDEKKILSFLVKCGIIAIDEKDKMIHFGIPNEFILMQVKKFFNKALKETIHNIYNPQFSISLHIYSPFSQQNNELHINIKKLLKIKSPTTKAEAAMQHQQEQQAEHNQQGAKSVEKFGTKVSGGFSFNNFVSGSHNNFAMSAAKAVADKPGTVYNPFFIYGNVGLGKTHIMQAIANQITTIDENKTVLYLPATKLIDEIIMAIRTNKLSNLMRRFDDIDVLLIDDIQFLADKDKTQEIFHNIFNDFHTKNKQIVLTSDRPPKELNNIEARLKSRFALGLVTDIQKPDYETRIAILQTKLLQKGQNVSFDLLAILAKHIKNNVRELEGALNIIITRQSLTGGELTEKDMFECLKTLGYKQQEEDEQVIKEISQMNTRSIVSYASIVEFASSYYNISVADLKSAKRKKEITQARQLLMVVAKKYFSRTLERIGDYFGGKNHATVIYAINNFNKKIKHDKNFAHDYNVILEQIER